MRNPYRRTDIFRCRHESHARFGYRVSSYHVLRAKRCYPSGCVAYRWFCHRFAKGMSCVRGFHRVGRLCFGCTHYRDTRMHYQPEVVIPHEEFLRFLDEVQEFEEWLSECRYSRLEILATVARIQPRLIKIREKSGARLVLGGYIVRLEEAFLGRTPFEDPVYLELGAHLLRRFGLGQGIRIEFQANLRLSDGRLHLFAPSRMEVVERSEHAVAAVEDAEALLGRLVATRVPEGVERCLSCPRATLVEVEVRGGRAKGPRRELYCLEGIQEHALCVLPILDRLREELVDFELCGDGEVLG